ncbi:MAG TPA: alpha/beta fold hydrolase [Devosiaceae bacterium]|jgi:pimeloyl-ACP methyl ester carboxylesterase|nr:alpha/beta fold hydrolase [Devosiaceae bacterium]
MLTARTIRIAAGNVRLLDSCGSGLPLVLIHGAGASKEVFMRQLESPLGEQYRIIAMDLPGHGDSDDARDPATAYTLRGFAAAVGEVLKALGIARTAVYGWSLGGHIAIELLASNPAVAGLMLTGAPPVAPGPLGMLRGFHTHWDLLLASKEHFSARDATRFHNLCFGDDGSPTFLKAIERADGRARPIVFRSMMRGECADQKQAVERAGVPIAMINGAHDPIVRLGYLSALSYRMLWDERCYVIAGAGHAPFWSAAGAFNELLGRFLPDVEIAATAEDERIAHRA